jgi:hypothetical protein
LVLFRGVESLYIAMGGFAVYLTDVDGEMQRVKVFRASSIAVIPA